jgi:hypothetical protein
MTMTRAKALKIRALAMEVATDMTDPEASTLPEMFPKLKQDGSLVKAGTRINWNGTIKRAAVDLWDTEANNPDNAPSLWENLNYKDGYRIIPETITVGTAFGLDEYGYWGDVLYKSLIDNNVWTPEQYPTGWEAVA